MTPAEQQALANDMINRHLAGRALRDCFGVVTAMLETLLRSTPPGGARMKTAAIVLNIVTTIVDTLVGPPKGSA